MHHPTYASMHSQNNNPGAKWDELETKFPSVIHGAAAVSFGGKLWVIGGSSFNKHQATVISWDGSIWFRGSTLTYARSYPAVVVWEHCTLKASGGDGLEGNPVLAGVRTAQQGESKRCQEALYVVGGLNGSTSIPEVEVATLGLQLDWHVLPQLLPTQRNRLGAVVFKKQPAPAG